MKTLVLWVACAALVACGQRSIGGKASLASTEDSVSYVVGYQIGGNLKQQGVPARMDALTRGLRDAFGGAKSVLTEDQMRSTVMGYQQKRMSAMASTNDSAAQRFLSENAKQPGVTTTASGLQWKVITVGKGPHPGPTSSVTVHYKGTLLSGVAFDSSYGGKPVTFPLNRVIPGWTEAVQLMNAGAKYRFWIPAKLAYGQQGSPPAIGPNQALIFEV